MTDEQLLDLLDKVQASLKKSVLPKMTAEMVAKLEDIVTDDMKEELKESLEVLKDQVAKTVRESIAVIPPKRIEVSYPDREELVLEDEVLHEKMGEVLDLEMLHVLS